jgi:hypothetical protein
MTFFGAAVPSVDDGEPHILFVLMFERSYKIANREIRTAVPTLHTRSARAGATQTHLKVRSKFPGAPVRRPSQKRSRICTPRVLDLIAIGTQRAPLSSDGPHSE